MKTIRTRVWSSAFRRFALPTILPFAFLTFHCSAQTLSNATNTTITLTPPAAPYTPMDFMNDVGAYFSSVNTNLTWTNTPAELWTAMNYESGVNTSAELGFSYDVYKPSANLAISPEVAMRNAGVAGTVVSEQLGVGLSIFHYDLKLTGYGDGGFDNVANKPFGEVGARVKKKMNASMAAGISLACKHLFGARNSNVPNVGVSASWTF